MNPVLAHVKPMALITIALIFLVLARESIALKPPCRLEYGAPLLNAVADRKIQEVRELLSSGADPNVRVGDLNPLLLTFLRTSTTCRRHPPHVELFQILVSAGADVKADDLIYRAAESGDVEILQAAVNAGASINAPSRRGGTPLTAAIQQGKSDAVKFLLVAGVDPNQVIRFPGSSSARTALHDAARRPGPENLIAKLLVAHGAKYQINNQYGPFYDLSRFYMEPKGDIGELIDLFIKVGGDINEEADPRRQMLSGLMTVPPVHTPLNVGLISTLAPREVFEAMLKKGANPNKGALYALAGRRDYANVPLKRKDLLRLLFQFGARPDLTPTVGNTGVLEAAGLNFPEYARELNEILKDYQ